MVKALNHGTDSRGFQRELRADASMGKGKTVGEWFPGTLLWELRDMGRAVGPH